MTTIPLVMHPAELALVPSLLALLGVRTPFRTGRSASSVHGRPAKRQVLVCHARCNILISITFEQMADDAGAYRTLLYSPQHRIFIKNSLNAIVSYGVFRWVDMGTCWRKGRCLVVAENFWFVVLNVCFYNILAIRFNRIAGRFYPSTYGCW